VCDCVIDDVDTIAVNNEYSSIVGVCDGVSNEGVTVTRNPYGVYVVCDGVVEKVVEIAAVIQQNTIMVVCDGVLDDGVVIGGIMEVNATTVV
jgi:hypothetical protein